MGKNWLNILARSLDQKLDPEEEQALSQQLKQSTELRENAEILDQLREQLPLTYSDLPAVDFSGQILQAVSESSIDGDIRVVQLFDKWAPQVAAACLIIMSSIGVSIYVQEGQINTDTVMGIDQLESEDAYAILSEEEIKQINESE